MNLDRIRITTEVPKFYVENGHKALNERSVENLDGAAAELPPNFAPPTLPTAAIMDSSGSLLERFRSAQGLYVPANEKVAIPTISLNPELKDLPALERAIFWHEFGHHIWARAAQMGDSVKIVWNNRLEKLLSKVEKTDAYREAMLFDMFRGHDYLSTKEEVWVRAVTYLLLEYANDEIGKQANSVLMRQYSWSAGENASWYDDLNDMLDIIGFQI